MKPVRFKDCLGCLNIRDAFGQVWPDVVDTFKRLRWAMASLDQLYRSDAEKKIARRVCDQALQRELDGVTHRVKAMARDIKNRLTFGR